jgi:maltooligosyltrehalose synthase
MSINNPGSTYRVQLQKDFNFKDLKDIAVYLQQLGIKTLYASPVFESMPGSTHGYDGTDPNKINPEIGTEAELTELSTWFLSQGMQWLQDIVPNHLSFHEKNKWLMDVLAKGKASKFAGFFDIIWDHPIYGNKVMVPFRGAPLEKYLQENIPLADHYMVTDWKETDRNINYRRFFTVNNLICTNVQNVKVFSAYHKLIQRLVKNNIFHGLRVDHIDGLYDPRKYLKQLRELSGASTYVIVEKILEPDENMPDDWEVQGTSGYEFLGMVNNLFTYQPAEKSFDELYQEITGDRTSVNDLIKEKKSYILFNHMHGELDNLVRLYKHCCGRKDQTNEATKQNIADYLISCPVYRYYGNDIPFMQQDRNNKNEALRQFYQRAMQFTGPLMAKGVEDTLMYTYNRFIGHNEVGDTPESFGISTDKFHELMGYRQQHWPLSLNTTSTHDTKRGEDARARLNALTDLHEEWAELIRKWRVDNEVLKTNGLPDANDEYFIYQSLVATHPLFVSLSGHSDGGEAVAANNTYSDRIAEYLHKALREAKLHSNWAEPNTDYERAAIQFAHSLISGENKFHDTFIPFLKKVSDLGMINSLSQLLLKFTCPGVPDTYQGTELWDLSLVDPDNRRPVDYAMRKKLLSSSRSFYELWDDRANGHIKLLLLRQLLKIRGDHSSVFTGGEYIPVQITGRFKNNALAYIRSFKDKYLLVVVPLHIYQVSDNYLQADWQDTKIILPTGGYETGWEDLLKGTVINELSLDNIFQVFPIGLLVNQ